MTHFPKYGINIQNVICASRHRIDCQTIKLPIPLVKARRFRQHIGVHQDG